VGEFVIKKIVHLVDGSGEVYGAEKVILSLSEEMKSSGKYTPVIACIVHDKNERCDLYNVAQNNGIESIKVRLRNNLFFFDIFSIAFALRREKTALIHSHGYKPSVLAFIVMLLTGIPIMATCHLWFTGSSQTLRSRTLITIEKYLYRFFRKVVSVSPEIQEVLRGVDVKEERLQVIDNGIIIADFKEKPHEEIMRLREELGLDENTFAVLNVGRLSEQKAQKNIVEAARILQENRIKAKFFILGEGKLRQTLENMIRDYKLDNVFLLGFRDNIPDIMQAADVFLLPSLDEGLPIVLLEAMASRLPVIVTPVGAIKNVIKHTKNGVIIPVNDIDAITKAIEFMKSEDKKREELCYNAFEDIKNYYSSTSMFEKYDVVYQDIVG